VGGKRVCVAGTTDSSSRKISVCLEGDKKGGTKNCGQQDHLRGGSLLHTTGKTQRGREGKSFAANVYSWDQTDHQGGKSPVRLEAKKRLVEQANQLKHVPFEYNGRGERATRPLSSCRRAINPQLLVWKRGSRAERPHNPKGERHTRTPRPGQSDPKGGPRMDNLG